MAWHPEDIHSTLGKLSFYCSDQIKQLNRSRFQKTYWRVFYWRPLLVLQNDLFILDTNSDGSYRLKPAQFGKLQYHYSTEVANGERELGSIIVDVVTEQSLIGFMKAVVREDDEVEEKLFDFREANRTKRSRRRSDRQADP